MVAYTSRVPAGFAGTVSRSDSLTVEQQIIDSGTPPTAYGRFVKIVAGKVQPIASGDAATVVYGLAVRPYPAQSTTNALGASTPPTSGIMNVLKRGYMSVPLDNGTAAKNGTVYVRVTVNGGLAVGNIETAADSGKCVAVTGAYFTGPADSNGIVEVAFNI